MAVDEELTAAEASPSLETSTQDAPVNTEDVNPKKRPREEDDDDDDHDNGDKATVEDGKARSSCEYDGVTAAGSAEEPPKLSKNQLRKQKRQRLWEERRDDRKRQRKEKRHDKTARRRLEREEKAAELAAATGVDKEEALKSILEAEKKESKDHHRSEPVPVSFIIDCDFEKYMHDGELVSLASQITRSYSMNKQGRYQAHLLVSSWGGKLRERYETVLKSSHRNWKGVSFVEADFVEAGKEAWEIMKGPKGGRKCPALGGDEANGEQEPGNQAAENAEAVATGEVPGNAETPSPDDKLAAAEYTHDSIVYLSADSPHILDKLEPYTSYVIGGLVDRNREKFLCQRRAEEKGVRTAKLPIGEYMQMASRKVLATNHVVEIMSKWLETGDWGKAFTEIIPKRKGGRLKSEGGEDDEDGDKDEEDELEAEALEESGVVST